MDIPTEVIITMLVGIAFGMSMWKEGKKEGASRLLEILYDQKIIAYDNKGDIKPNPFWQPIQRRH